jgi:hypothetical protein
MFEKKIIASINFERCLYLGIIFIKDPRMFFSDSLCFVESFILMVTFGILDFLLSILYI